MFNILNQMKLIIILLFTTLLFWACSTNSTGPEEDSALLEASSLAIGSLNQVFVATLSGLYQSLDNGETWKLLNNFRSHLVSVSPLGNIYCTSHRETGLYTSEQTLWRSTDGGKTFLKTGWVKESPQFIWLAFNNQDHIFVRTLFSGSYRSTSQGASWERLSMGVRNLIAPDDIFANSGDGVYRSNDSGDNWLKVFERERISGDTSYSYDALAFNSNGEVFAGINAWHFLGDSVETGMIYHSDDNGNNWMKTTTLNSDITHLAVNSEDNIFAITEQNEIFISTDNGVRWKKVGSIFSDESIKTLMINSNDHLFIRTLDNQANHVYRSLNDGTTWEQIWPYF